MPRLRPLLLAAVVLLGPACPPAAAAPRTTAPAAPAMAADALLDTIGVNLDPRDEALVAHLRGAGIRHVRARGVADPADPTWAALRALTEAGLRVDLVAEPGTDWATFADAAASLGKGLESLEAEGDAGPLRLAARAHPALRDVPLLAPAGDGAADYHTARLQLDGRCPGCVPGPADGLGSASPGGSLQVTEATLGVGVPEAVAARYLPRLLLGQATTATRTYLGALAGEQADPGLLGADGSPARAHRDLANLVALLADPGPAFAPGRLAYRLSGDTDGLRHLLLQKADGRFWLVLWVEKPSFDPASGRELALPAQPVSIGLADPVAAARAFAPDLGTAPERHFAGPTRTIELEVPDRPLLVELLPQPPPEAVSAAPATSRPGGSPPAGDPSRAPGPPAAAGGDRRTPATTRGSAPAAAAPAGRERGPLAFTGSAALPLLVASGLLVLVGVAALAASRRRWHHHR
ncbi:MAG TPA: hypothetical protein VFU54_07935 [Actinomycetota bacterium]|nr:hypothetical protein [Actinomycetota bacterium]